MTCQMRECRSNACVTEGCAQRLVAERGTQRQLFSLGVSCLIAAAGCEALTPRLAPVQSSRVVQVESFRQTFQVENVLRAERVFRSVLGPENYAALSPEEWMPYVEKMLRGSVEALGTGTYVVSLLPTDHHQFFFEGWGHYSVLDLDAKQIMVSGEFTAVDDGPHSTAEFEQGYFDTRVRQTLVRHIAPQHPSFVHEFELVLRVHVRRLDPDLYILDYDAGHEIGIPNEEGNLEVAGCLQFEHRDDGRKLIDLRGIGLLRNDYGDKLSSAGFAPERALAAPKWLELRQCPAHSKGPDCACPHVAHGKATPAGSTVPAAPATELAPAR